MSIDAAGRLFARREAVGAGGWGVAGGRIFVRRHAGNGRIQVWQP
jgi:hypothetical protein